MSATSRRYEVLDGLRGVAAIGVLGFHIALFLGAPSIVRHGYLAVDFFFMLSGFVLAHAYTERLASMPGIAFPILRLQRLWPLSILGVLMGAVYMLLRWRMQPDLSEDLPHILADAGLNVFLLPKLWSTKLGNNYVFPENIVLWSLSLELFINIVWARFLSRTRRLHMMVLIGVAALLLVPMVQTNGNSNLGWSRDNYLGGMVRAVLGFLVGVMVWRFRPVARHAPLTSWAVTLAMICVICYPRGGPLFDNVVILFIFPLMLYCAAGCQNNNQGRALRVLGEISYPLYTLHVPLLLFSALVINTLGARLRNNYWDYTLVAPMVVAALVLSRCYDAPIRRWCSRRTGPLFAVLQTSRPAVLDA